MTEYKVPGVYVDEASGLPALPEIETAVPCFLGYSATGKPLIPRRIASLAEYEEHFGGASTREDEPEHPPSHLVAGVPPFLMHYALRHYFANGGGPCLVLSVGQLRGPKRAADFERGLAVLATEDAPTLIVLADAVTLPLEDYLALCCRALDQCNRLGNRFLLADVPTNEAATDVSDFRAIDHPGLSYAAAYYPFLETDFALSSVTHGERAVLPPSPAVAGIYCRVDRDTGVWKAPANVGIRSVVGPVIQLTSRQQEGMNVDPVGGKSINAIRQFTGRGTLVWGARTLAGNDNEWRYVPVRRLANHIRETCVRGTAWAVFEPNDANTWAAVKTSIETFLLHLWKKGALPARTPDEAFFVRVGLNDTMTQIDVLEGRLIVELGFAPLRPAEFVLLRFTQFMRS